MPYTMHIDPDVNCAFFKHHGHFDIGSVAATLEAMLTHPDYQSGMNYCHDALDITIPSEISFGDITAASKRQHQSFENKLGKCRGAIVVGDGQSYAKVHQFIVTGRLGTYPVERKVFREIDKAKEWLGLPKDYEIDWSVTMEATVWNVGDDNDSDAGISLDLSNVNENSWLVSDQIKRGPERRWVNKLVDSISNRRKQPFGRRESDKPR